MSKQTKMKLLKKPTKPDPSECCNRNCENCVYVYYEKALERWEKKVANIIAKK